MDENSSNSDYWRANVRVILISLAIWFIVSFGIGIIFRPALEGITIGGADIGFWFAQNGSIYVFLVLIFVYAAVMNRIDHKYGVEE